MDCVRFGNWFADGRGSIGTDASGSVDTVSAGDSVGLLGPDKATKDNYDGEHDAFHDRKSPARYVPVVRDEQGKSRPFW
jgi:hypothetical protein